MTERRPRDVDAARRRHRPSLFGETGRLPSRRTTRVLLAGATAGAVVATMLAYGTTGSPVTAELPPAAAVLPLDPVGSVGVDTPLPPPTAPPGATSPTPSTVDPGTGGSLSADPSPSPSTVQPSRREPSTSPAPPPTAAPGGGGADDADDRDTPPPPPPPPPASPASPRVVGPTSLDGFDSFLDSFCEKRRFRGALLLNGRRTPETGRWVCAKFSDLDTIDLDAACREGFGGTARAREQVAGDIRTVRCFDS